MPGGTVACDVAVVGAGSVGIAVAYALVGRPGAGRVLLIDEGAPMALTSAQSGENYRNWWPHPVMTAFVDRSITLMEGIAAETANRIAMTRRGYALATRGAADGLVAQLYEGYGAGAEGRIRVHDGRPGYRPAGSEEWQGAPDGVDVLLDRAAIRAAFPSFSEDVSAVLHVRRAGAISTQQLGQVMLERVREGGGGVCHGRLDAIERTAPFVLRVESADGPVRVVAERLVNAAGPFVGRVAVMLGETLPVRCCFQQKIAFEDRDGAVPRTMPFGIDLDAQPIPWTEEEREVLAGDPAAAGLLAVMPGGVHCRPDGGVGSTWVKLGWAYNRAASEPEGEAPIDPQFRDTVIRGASRLQPALAAYVGRLPRQTRHYGGYYAMTEENWPLIGPMATEGAFVAGALSGYGSMAACAAGELCASWVSGGRLPAYAATLSLGRYADAKLMAGLRSAGSKGVL